MTTYEKKLEEHMRDMRRGDESILIDLRSGERLILIDVVSFKCTCKRTNCSQYSVCASARLNLQKIVL
jgi:hypothetical protein